MARRFGVFDHVMAVVGFVKNGIDLPDTATAEWLQTTLASALFVAVFALTRRSKHAA